MEYRVKNVLISVAKKKQDTLSLVKDSAYRSCGSAAVVTSAQEYCAIYSP